MLGNLTTNDSISAFKKMLSKDNSLNNESSIKNFMRERITGLSFLVLIIYDNRYILKGEVNEYAKR